MTLLRYRNRFSFFFLLLLGISGSAMAGQANEGRIRELDGKKIFEYLNPNGSPDQAEWIQFGEIEIKPKGTQFYHWGPEEDVKNWVAHGISEEAIRNSADHIDTADVAGGGFYVSLNPIDSAAFGPKQLVAQPEHDVILLVVPPQYDFDKIGYQDSLGNIIPSSVLAKAGLEGIRYDTSWIVFIKASPLESLYADPWEALVQSRNARGFSFLQFWFIQSKFPLPLAIQQNPAFKRILPTISKFLDHQPLTEAEGTEEAQKIKADMLPYPSLTQYSQLIKDELWIRFTGEIHFQP